MLEDTINTSQFTDGKLKTATMYGQFLITGVSFVNGVSSFTVNRQARILSSNIRVGNGIMHIVDRMLTPAARTIAQEIEANPDYSIFTQALKETGFYDQLNKIDADTSKRWRTVIAESNQALADSGYNSYAALKARYSQLGNPMNSKDSLNMYVAYHIINGLYFLGDIINFNAQLTLLPEEVITIKHQNQEVILNEMEFNGVLEKGVTLLRPSSDNSATNGVWHSSNGHTMAKFRKPQALYWDVAMFPELMNQPAYFRRQSFYFPRPTATDKPIASIDWDWKAASSGIQYFYGGTGTPDIFNVNRDRIALNFGGPNRATWAEFKTPTIIKGRYKVWICYIAQTASLTNVFVNGIPMSRQVDFSDGAGRMPAGTPEERESIGWKNYVTSNSPNRHNARLVGIVDIATTGVQTVRFESVSGTGNNALQLDMIHFIPVDENQIVPRFAPDGSMSYIP
ncbi:fasciclin domain-containing protein [Niabella hibiscisoli]|uniref:fasciclin domain-containing protein n=1 Tax=Niabella hibiscisoli TaxID=1825928 RepID=UPI001F0EE76E|nr:fasciclin domain-containing protein [Niabella hibiscisoli]MCH5717987.1 fasciclin domain-containing protein [Niabella hibiscisoli]